MKTLTAPTPYGYQELRQVHHRYMMLALLMAITVQMMVIGTYHLSEWLEQDDIIKVPPPPIPYEHVPLPPSLTNTSLLTANVVIPTKASEGIPVPVPDFKVNPDIDFSPQALPNPVNPNASGLNGIGDGEMIVIPPDPLPTEFRPFEKPPEPVLKTYPEYPDIAKRTGLEGTVVVHVLLNKEGKVKKALVAKTNNEIFDESALAAAQKWVFTPALMQGKPVMVWITIPFRFRLTGK